VGVRSLCLQPRERAGGPRHPGTPGPTPLPRGRRPRRVAGEKKREPTRGPRTPPFLTAPTLSYSATRRRRRRGVRAVAAKTALQAGAVGL
jgi:hypothetical protein